MKQNQQNQSSTPIHELESQQQQVKQLPLPPNIEEERKKNPTEKAKDPKVMFLKLILDRAFVEKEKQRQLIEIFLNEEIIDLQTMLALDVQMLKNLGLSAKILQAAKEMYTGQKVYQKS